MATKLDPVTFEILRHRLEEIVNEAYYTMARVSGNAVITEAGDHEEAILNANGETIMVGGGIVEWTQCLEEAGRYISKEYEENPGILEGDQFVLNCTEIAAVHLMDIQVLKPVFWNGERIAWVNTAGHNMDVGGINIGGAHLDARERVQEGLSMWGIKLCERGVVRKDIETTIKNMTRQPELLVLELRARMAANNAAERRLLGTIQEFGIDKVKAIFEELPRYSEQRIRQRLGKLPDGEFTARHYFESIVEGEGPLAVQCKLIKKGTTLTLDFTGSSPQSAGAQNVALPGAKSNAECPFLMMLAHDIPWNYGLWGVINWVVPLGTVVNPTDTAPVSINTPAGAGYVTIGCVLDCISQLYLCSDEKQEAFACGSNAFNNPMLYGRDKNGKYFITMMMENLICGAGAMIHRDGDDTCSNMWTTKPQVANLERSEQLFPWLYLWRKEAIDTGGPGRHRGGTACYNAFIPWSSDKLEAHDNGMGDVIRLSNGLAGGYPAPNVKQYIIRESNIEALFEAGEMPAEGEEISGKRTEYGCNTTFPFNRGDVYTVYFGGGGGFGDPLSRDPGKIEADIRNEYISVDEAARTYGVVVDPKTMKTDGSATAKRRSDIRSERLKAAVPLVKRAAVVTDNDDEILDWGGVLQLVGQNGTSRYWKCMSCNHVLGEATSDWKVYAARVDAPLSRGQPPRFAVRPEEFSLREFYCPECAELLEVLCVRRTDPDVQTFRFLG
ncbi:MAG: hydantoinase B/oxoprolinase family protein [Steroidobacteraceae bacterium]